MSPTQIKAALFVEGLALLHALILRWRESFRRSIQRGDTVGIAFGDYVVNRKVLVVLPGEVSVKNWDESLEVTVPLNRVFMPSKE